MLGELREDGTKVDLRGQQDSSPGKQSLSGMLLCAVSRSLEGCKRNSLDLLNKGF